MECITTTQVASHLGNTTLALVFHIGDGAYKLPGNTGVHLRFEISSYDPPRSPVVFKCSNELKTN